MSLKRTPLKRRSKNPKAKAKAEAWKEFSIFIRRRDPLCITCQASTTEAGHFIHNVSMLKLHFDPRNVHGQCARCNRWKHGNLAIYTLFMIDQYGRSVVNELNEIAKNRNDLNIDKPSIQWYRDIRDQYKELNGS